MTDLINISFDGLHESTVFTDASGKVWTPYNGAKLDTNVKRVGTASGSFSNGQVGYSSTRGGIYTPDHSDFVLGNSDFTFDFILYPLGLQGKIWSATICGQYQDNNPLTDNSFYINVYTNSIVMSYSNGVNGYGSLAALNVKMFPDTWHHIAIMRSANVGSIYLDGYRVAQSAMNVTIPDSSRLFVIGGYGQNQIGGLNVGLCGYLDSFRFIKSARFSGDRFDPPGGPYINYVPKIVFGGE